VLLFAGISNWFCLFSRKKQCWFQWCLFTCIFVLDCFRDYCNMHLAFSKIAWYCISKIWSEYIEVASYSEAFAQANTIKLHFLTWESCFLVGCLTWCSGSQHEKRCQGQQFFVRTRKWTTINVVLAFKKRQLCVWLFYSRL
jgi:hypothetical protein